MASGGDDRTFTDEPYSAWISNTELTPITAEECKDIMEKGKSKQLIQAYLVAAENHDLSYFKTLLSDHQNLLAEEAKLRAEREAKKASKTKRKSNAGADDAEGDLDDMDDDDDKAGAKRKSKKRKKSFASDGEEQKVTRYPSPPLPLGAPPIRVADSGRSPLKRQRLRPSSS
jgi:phosphopantothenoylcysteine synthetase/decarboxylase